MLASLIGMGAARTKGAAGKPAPIAGTTPGIEPSGLSRCTRPGTGTQVNKPRV
jgi:hypothetical protein